MTKYNWDYEALGFKSENEMKESIDRVERKMKMDPLELEIEQRSKASTTINNGGIDFTAMNEGARLEELDRLVHNRIIHDKEQAKAQAEQEKWQNLFKAAGDSVAAENEAKAQRELQKKKEELESDLQKEVYSKHRVKTDKEKELNNAYSKLLG